MGWDYSGDKLVNVGIKHFYPNESYQNLISIKN